MSKIRVLTPDVYNKISAGEVIENPVGVVKELVENSIDAGATNIVIEVVEGGFSSISVTDNGCGIEHEDIDRAFVEHATSKVDSLDDLYYLQTLGFRGEALASIAAVSKVQLTTRTSENEVAICVDVENGQVIDRKYVSANLGTKIVVHDLFYNTPARKKFLKTPSREGTEISKFVAKLILTNPKLNISYYLDGQLVYKNGGKGLQEAVFAIYGAEVLEKCLEVNERWELMTIRGYVGNTTFTKPNKNWQTLSVNGRCITDTKINASIMQAYKGYLMTRQYPFFVLDLQIPGDRVDVNVHPKKSEVRFMQHDKVAAFFYNAVTKVLVKYIEMTRNDPFSMFSYEVPAEVEPIGKVPDNFDLDSYLESKGIQLMNPHQAEDVLDIEQATEDIDTEIRSEQSLMELSKVLTVEQVRKDMGLPPLPSRKKKHPSADDEPLVQMSIPVIEDEDELLYNRTRILGVAFRTYIILEIDDKIILVDQHAAHERILFDQYMKHRDDATFQDLMFPFVFNVTDEEDEFISKNLANIKRAGFKLQPFGKNTYRIASISPLLETVHLNTFVEYLLSSVDELKFDEGEFLVEKIASRACKAAVKAGYTPNKYDITYILKHVVDGGVMTCPHGRPITTTITKAELEKMFKRRV